MKTIKNANGKETFIFTETFEPEAFEQLKKMCNFETYLDEKIRIMHNSHLEKAEQ